MHINWRKSHHRTGFQYSVLIWYSLPGLTNLKWKRVSIPRWTSTSKMRWRMAFWMRRKSRNDWKPETLSAGEPLQRGERPHDEKKPEDQSFRQDGECSKTQDGLVDIYLTQRMPIVRIKSISNEDYYIDDHNVRSCPTRTIHATLSSQRATSTKWYAKKPSHY